MPDFGEEILRFGPSASTPTVAALGQSVEAPFNADITDVTVTSSVAPTGSDLIVDILVNGTSVFAAALGTVGETANAQTGGSGGINSSVTTMLFDPTGGQNNVQVGQVLLIGTEKVLVTSVTGSSQVDQGGATGLMSLGITRGYDSTTAAVHAAGASVFPAKPFIPISGTSSAAEDQPYAGVISVPPINKGDIITAAITQIGSGTAGGLTSATVTLVER